MHIDLIGGTQQQAIPTSQVGFEGPFELNDWLEGRKNLCASFVEFYVYLEVGQNIIEADPTRKSVVDVIKGKKDVACGGMGRSSTCMSNGRDQISNGGNRNIIYR